MKRSPMKRGPWRKARPRAPIPATAHEMGRGWRRLARFVLARDEVCRRCGRGPKGSGAPLHVDHLIPRRLCLSTEAANMLDNLAALCNQCHAFKTQTVEPELYKGNVQTFELFLSRLAEQGPIPPRAMIEIGYEILTRSIRERL
jgi:hypothetical protein